MSRKSDKKEVVDDIRSRIENSRGTHIWSDYVNALRLISQVVFTRSSGFVLELLQNAEDAGLGQDFSGLFEIRINKRRVNITHNGRPFAPRDVEAICGIRSSKKPEQGSLGYLGIGFKSVFRVSDRPEVYSNGFQFKFDRYFPGWDNPASTPWHVLPIWLDEPTEAIDPQKTTFIIPFREEAGYRLFAEEATRLRTELYLFLRWLRRIEVVDEDSQESWVLENLGETAEGITILRHDDVQQRFTFFRRTVEVPEWVRQDGLTQEYRVNVTKREVAIAFALDENGDLAPVEAGAMYGGVYSFLPLSEAKSGAEFPIQADFLVQPGRDAINYEAKWNHWLVEEIASLCKEAIGCFKQHPRWKYQFMPVFEFSKSYGDEAYDRLFGPKLITPVENFIQDGHCIPTLDGTWAKPNEVIDIAEAPEAIEDLAALGVIGERDIASVLGGQSNLKVVHPDFREASSSPIKRVTRQNLLENEAFLENARNRADAPILFRKLYLWLSKHPIYSASRRPLQIKGYHDVKFILTSQGELAAGGDVFLADLPPVDPILKDLAKTLEESRLVVHPDILAGIEDEEQRKSLRGFLVRFTGVQILDGKTICREALLPKILTDSRKPSRDELLKCTIYCHRILGKDIGRAGVLWILTKKREIRTAREVFFPTEFKPEPNWEVNKRYVPGISFISPLYLEGGTDDAQVKEWREFFRAGGVGDSPDNGVEDFAIHYAEEQLKKRYESVVRVEKRNFGYDLEAEGRGGERAQIEVKGLTWERDVELTENETQAADTHKDSFWLCVVSSIPETPIMYMVNNPAAPGVGKKDKLIIACETWKSGRWV